LKTERESRNSEPQQVVDRPLSHYRER